MNRAYRLIPFLFGEQGTYLSALDENLNAISKKVGYHQERAYAFSNWCMVSLLVCVKYLELFLSGVLFFPRIVKLSAEKVTY